MIAKTSKSDGKVRIFQQKFCDKNQSRIAKRVEYDVINYSRPPTGLTNARFLGNANPTGVIIRQAALRLNLPVLTCLVSL